MATIHGSRVRRERLDNKGPQLITTHWRFRLSLNRAQEVGGSNSLVSTIFVATGAFCSVFGAWLMLAYEGITRHPSGNILARSR